MPKPETISRLRAVHGRSVTESTSSKQRRILVVDDEPDVRAVIGATLDRHEYETVLASSGSEAITCLRDNGPFDLILSDIMMGGTDGLRLLDYVQSTVPDTPIVMVTAVHDIGIAIGAMRNGAYDYLLKPFERDQLLSTVHRALEHRRLVQQNNTYQQKLEDLVAARTEMLRYAMQDLERSYDITLEALGDALDLKDSETEGHSKRVTAYTIALARAMNLSSAEIKSIARGAFLHDIGKMAIPDRILLKPGRLDEDEQAIMRDHCWRGYKMLQKIPFLRDAAEIVYSHQEHYDGTGYPRQLRENQIPLGARIFSVADALDAITSDRPYRKASSFAQASAEIQRCAGAQFDPAVVEVFASLPIELWQDLRRELMGQAQRISSLILT